MEETWKTIEDFENYEFSNKNRVRNKKTDKFLKLHKGNAFILNKDKKYTKIALSKLKQKYFPEPIEYLPGEIFLVIEGFPNYEISNHGRVYNSETGTFLIPQVVNDFYQVSLSKNNKAKGFKVHRLVAQYFIPNPDNFPYVLYIDGNRSNYVVENLEWSNKKKKK